MTLATFDQVWMSSRQPHVEAFDAMQMVDWLLSEPFREDMPKGLTNGAELSIPRIRNAIETMPSLPVCPRRLWNMALTCARGSADLPEIIRLLQGSPQIRHDKHVECTADLCHFDDDNSTTVQQFHADTCPGQAICNNYYFNPKFNERPQSDSQEFFSTAWRVSRDADRQTVRLTPNCAEYMAISHVWCDGTGAGQKPPGNVNACLVNFFNSFATGKMGMWWDTISLPTGRKQRGLALSVMHHNYQNAAFTLVHDRELVELDWKEDGSPCLALALSTWFSRGWTALELQKSTKIKVLFRDPETGQPIVKDLDEDILAKDDSWSHMGHRAASNVIQKARRKFNPGSISSVLDTLRSRYTSWARDRMIIGSLMLDIKGFETTWSKCRMTQEVIKSHGILSPDALLHGQITISPSGPWSWCPVSFLDIHDVPLTNPLFVGKHGEITGSWRSIPLSHAVVDYTIHSHVSVKLRIELALRIKSKCLLIARSRDKYKIKKTGILGLNLGVVRGQTEQPGEKGTRLCQYVGTVVASYEGTGFLSEVCFGSEKEMPHFEDAIANTNGQDHGGWTPLHVAAIEGRELEVKRLLTEQPGSVSEVDDFGFTPAYWAAENVRELFP